MRAPDFWKSRGALALLLSPLGMLYGLSVAWKAATARPYKCAVPVICVGNLTVGGSGKTPIAMAVAAKLQLRGAGDVFFLTRGYGGNAEGPLLVNRQPLAMVGDEALMLARIAPTVMSKNRAAGAMFAIKQGASVIVMDDGHQNFTLAKNLSLVVVDDLGNGLMIPAGPLRESVAQGLARADAVIAMQDNLALGGFSGPVLRARLVPDGARFSGEKVFAFAGIGRPEKFITSLQQSGAIITGTQFFADHHPYSEAEIAALKARAGDAMLVTTKKDMVRLSEMQRRGIIDFAVEAEFDQPQLLDSLLATV
jgi:tetraacyldisaccharide 4'-kinase